MHTSGGGSEPCCYGAGKLAAPEYQGSRRLATRVDWRRKTGHQDGLGPFDCHGSVRPDQQHFSTAQKVRKGAATRVATAVQPRPSAQVGDRTLTDVAQGIWGGHQEARQVAGQG